MRGRLVLFLLAVAVVLRVLSWIRRRSRVPRASAVYEDGSVLVLEPGDGALEGFLTAAARGLRA